MKSCSSPRRGRSSPMMPLSSQWSHQTAEGSSQLDALLSHHKQKPQDRFTLDFTHRYKIGCIFSPTDDKAGKKVD